MERNGHLLLLAVVVMVLFAPSAWARWDARARAPDIFGIIDVVAGVVGSEKSPTDSLVVQCNDKDSLSLVLTAPASEIGLGRNGLQQADCATENVDQRRRAGVTQKHSILNSYVGTSPLLE